VIVPKYLRDRYGNAVMVTPIFLRIQGGGNDTMGIETALPSESAPEPDALPPADHIAISGSIATRGSMVSNITVSDTPLPARAEADAAILSNWYQPPSQPLPPRSTHVIQGGPASPPFPPPVHVDVPIIGVEARAEIGVVAAGLVLNAEARPLQIGAEPSILNHFDAKQSSFDTLMARVALLEATMRSRPAGVGHNQGPYFDETLSVDEAGIQNLIALLKVQRAIAPVDLAKLTEAAQIADPTINGWRTRIDQFVSGVLKGAGYAAGKEIIEQLAHASWVQSVYSALQSVFEALVSWMHLF
jgi:hypothetical protein